MKRRFSEEEKQKLQAKTAENQEEMAQFYAKEYKVLDARKRTKGKLGRYNWGLIGFSCLLVLFLLILYRRIPALTFHPLFYFNLWFLMFFPAEARNRKWSGILLSLLAYPKFNLTGQEQEQFNATIQRKLLSYNRKLVIIACASYPLLVIGYILKAPLFLLASSVGVLFFHAVQNRRWRSMARLLLEQQQFELDQKGPPRVFAPAVPRSILILLLVYGAFYGLWVSEDKLLPYLHRMLDESVATFCEPGRVTAVSFSKDGALLASLSRDIIRLREVATGKEIAVLYKADVFRSLDGRFEASQSESKIEVREVDAEIEIATLFTSGIQVKSPDGKFSVSVHRWDIKLRDIASGEKIATIRGHPGGFFDAWRLSLAFSPDGKLLASGSRDKTVKLWEVKSGKEIATLRGHTGSVNSVAFSPDGLLLASGSSDNSIKLWKILLAIR